MSPPNNHHPKEPTTTTTTTFNAVEFIQTRRFQVREHTDEEIQWWIDSYVAGIIPDYQVSAWLMAVCLNGLSARETATLTRCMMESGEQLQWRDKTENVKLSNFALVDKHSSGGVGDTISILLAPLVACFSAQAPAGHSICVPMMAGRGLGHTGGTIDKLESITGFRTNLSIHEFQNVCRTVGCVINTTGRTLCPADAKLYALRDVSGTVSSIQLQTASIMSKKIAERPDTLVLDVKFGRGSFQSNATDAETLAVTMVKTGEANGVCPTTALLTRMDHPIGCAVGNWLETWECIRIMRGWNEDSADDQAKMRLFQDLITLTCYQAGQMVWQTGKFDTEKFQSVDDLVQEARRILASGVVLEKFAAMVQAQGGDATTCVYQAEAYMAAAAEKNAFVTTTLTARHDGFVADIDALIVGLVSVQLGAGRKVAGEAVDPWAGIWFHVQVGDAVKQDETVVATVYYNPTTLDTTQLQSCLQRLADAIAYTTEPVTILPIITKRITSQGVEDLNIYY